MDFAPARQRHQPDFPGVARFKSDRIARRNIQTKTEDLLPIEREGTVYLKKMKMTPDLDRTAPVLATTRLISANPTLA